LGGPGVEKADLGETFILFQVNSYALPGQSSYACVISSSTLRWKTGLFSW